MNNNEMTIQIIIVTRNRLEYLIKTLKSVENQKIDLPYKIDIKISDNSLNNITEEYFKRHKEKYNYVKRWPSLSGIEHFKLVLTEISSDYFMIFHDDDIMKEGLISELISGFESSTVAVACNAYILNGNKFTNKIYSSTFKFNQIISKKSYLLGLYINRGRYVPFPGHIYKSEVAKIEIPDGFGKHSDVIFLTRVLELGGIKVLAVPLYYYRLHSEQDSFESDFLSKTKLIRFILNECNFKRTEQSIVACRLQIMYDELRTLIWINNKNYLYKVKVFFYLCIKNNNIIIPAKLLIRYMQFKFK